MSKFQELDRFELPKKFRGRNAVIVQLWWIIQGTLFAASPQFMYRWRVILLRLFGAQIGRKVIIRPSVKVTYPWKLKVGDNSWIGDNVVLYTLGNIDIGNNVVISQKSYLCTGSHDYTKKTFDINALPIIVEDEAWVASDVYIAPGIKVGEGAVIGARSSVFNDMPSAMICVGSPARPVKSRS